MTGLYSATSLKERTPTQVFSGEFCKVNKTPILQNTSKRVLLFYGKKYFINEIVKNPLKKRGRMGEWKQLVRKTTIQAKKTSSLSASSLHIVYYSKMSLFLFSLIPMIYWKHEFLEIMKSHWGLSAIRNYFSLRFEKIVFYLYGCYNNIKRLIIKFDKIKLSSLEVLLKKKNLLGFQKQFCIWVLLAGIWKKIAIFLISTLKFFNMERFMQN